MIIRYLHRRLNNIILPLLVVVMLMFLYSCNRKSERAVRIVILHTNDTHSHLDPFPENHPQFAGMGGYARRAWLIDSIRQAEKNVLVFDCGDFSQGTPYYNLFKGEPEVLLMNMMKYDAVTIGNHEFDYGTGNLCKILSKAEFSVISANYIANGNCLGEIITPYRVMEIDGIRIGVTGVGVHLQGLVPDMLFDGINVLNPIESANKTAEMLKKELNCHLVICLSHLGLERDNNIDDINLVRNSSHIDLVIGGHSHTPLENGKWVSNKHQDSVLIAQAGYGGVSVGEIVIYIKIGRQATIKKNKNQ